MANALHTYSASPDYVTYVTDKNKSTSYHGSDYCYIGFSPEHEVEHGWFYYEYVTIAFYKIPNNIKKLCVFNMAVTFPYASSDSGGEKANPVVQYSVVTADQVPTGSLTYNQAWNKNWTCKSTKYSRYGNAVIDTTNKTITYDLNTDTVNNSSQSGWPDGVSAIQCISDTAMASDTEYYLRVSIFGTQNYRKYKSVSKSSIKLSYRYRFPDEMVELTYPKGNISVNSSAESILSWDYSSEESSFGFVPTQQSYKISWNGGTGHYGTFEGTTAHYHTVPADIFPAGETIRWSVRTVSSTAQATTSSYAYFIAAGSTGAPVISSVTTDTAKPVVTWTVSSQDCYQVQFYRDDELLHDSGLVSGSSVRTYTYPGVLPNGTYYVKVRVINTYGYYTDYTSRAFILSYTEPTAPEYVNAPVNADYAVEISGDIPTGTTVTVLRTDEDGSNAINLGSFSGTPIKDYSGELNKAYHYSLMALDSNSKLAVSETATARIKADGCIIHDTRDYANYYHINITDDEKFDITRADNQSKTFAQVIGRRYPIKEQMDYIISTRQFTCFVYDDDYNGLMDLMLSGTSVYFRTTGEAFYADLTVSDRGSYVSGGRLVTIQLTRLSE